MLGANTPLSRAYQIDLDCLPMVMDMERNGILIDAPRFRELKTLHLQELSEVDRRVYIWAGRKFNVNSSQQKAEVLKKLGVKIPKQTATGLDSTKTEVLELVKHQHPIIPLLLEHSEIAKLISTYDDGIPSKADEDGRIRGSISYTSVVTGRFAMRKPNLMNIPTRTARGRALRGGFVARPGWVLVSNDLSQAEIRMAGIESGDEGLVRGYNEDPDFDVHTDTCMMIFGQVTPELRYIGKTVGFGIVYGLSASGLTVQVIGEFPELGWNDQKSQQVIDMFFSKRPGVYEYIEEAKAFARRYGYVVDMFGRRRNVPHIYSSKKSVRAEAERESVNFPIQSGATGIIKIGMKRARETVEGYGLQAQWLLQIHDELLCEAPEEEAVVTALVVNRELEEVGRELGLSVPIRAEAKIGRNWAEMVKLKEWKR